MCRQHHLKKTKYKTIRSSGIETDLTHSYDKSPFTNIKFRKLKRKQNATTMFDNTADRFRTVSWSNYNLLTGVVNLVYGANLPTSRNNRVIKWTHKDGQNVK